MYFLHLLVSSIVLFCGITTCYETQIQVHSFENQIVVFCTISKLIKSQRILTLRLQCPWSRSRNNNDYCYENCSPTCSFYGECKFLAKCSKEELYNEEGTNNDEFHVKYKFAFQKTDKEQLLGNFSCRYASQEVSMEVGSIENRMNFGNNNTLILKSKLHSIKKNGSENSIHLSNHTNENIKNTRDNSMIEKIVFITSFFALFIATCVVLFIIIRCVIQRNGASSGSTCSKVLCIKSDPAMTSRDLIILANKYKNGVGNYPNTEMDDFISVTINTPPMLGAVNVLERRHSDNAKRRYNGDSKKPSQASIHEYAPYDHHDLPPIPNVHSSEKLSNKELAAFQPHSLQYIPVSASRYQSLLAMEQQFIGAVKSGNGYFTPQPNRSSKRRMELNNRGGGSQSNLRNSLQNNLSRKVQSGQYLENKVYEINSCSENEDTT